MTRNVLYREGSGMDHVEGSAFALGPGEGRSIDLGAFAMSAKATAVDTGGAFSLLVPDGGL